MDEVYSSSVKNFSTFHATPLCPQTQIICAYPYKLNSVQPLFPLGFPTKTLFTFIVPPMRETWTPPPQSSPP